MSSSWERKYLILSSILYDIIVDPRGESKNTFDFGYCTLKVLFWRLRIWRQRFPLSVPRLERLSWLINPQHWPKGKGWQAFFWTPPLISLAFVRWVLDKIWINFRRTFMNFYQTEAPLSWFCFKFCKCTKCTKWRTFNFSWFKIF